ncbi:hypothetical protein LguiA_020752 [Lonicera macranthoides]
MLPIYLCPILYLPILAAQSPTQIIDSLLQHYAFTSILRQRTGFIYYSNATSDLAGIEVGAVRLRSGSLRRRGMKSYKEFQIPTGIIEDPYVERLVLVYQNLGNWSSFYYPLPGYAYLSSVLGLLSYNSSVSSSSAIGLDLRATETPILIRFQNVKPAPDGFSPKCLCFGLYGSLEFGNVLSGNVCSTTKQGHFAIVVELAAPAPAMAGEIPTGVGGDGGLGKYWEWVVGGCVVGGFVVMGLFGVLVVWVRMCREKRERGRMEAVAEGGAPLLMAAIGGRIKVPVATGTRTRPVLENEYLP